MEQEIPLRANPDPCLWTPLPVTPVALSSDARVRHYHCYPCLSLSSVTSEVNLVACPSADRAAQTICLLRRSLGDSRLLRSGLVLLVDAIQSKPGGFLFIRSLRR